MEQSEIWPTDKQIQQLSLSNLGLTDIEPLAYYQHLTELELDHNEIDDLAPLSVLKNLQRLDLSFNPIDDLTSIAQVNTLEQLLSNHLIISSLPASIDWPRLKQLSLSGNTQLKSIHPIDKCTELVELYIKGCPIADLSPIGHLSSLAVLNITYNAYQNWQKLTGLINLRRLSINGRALIDLSQLPVFIQVEQLSINQCPALEDIRPLAQWVGLKYLNLNYNAILDFSPLLTLPHLRRLEIKGNPGTLAKDMRDNHRIEVIAG